MNEQELEQFMNEVLDFNAIFPDAAEIQMSIDALNDSYGKENITELN